MPARRVTPPALAVTVSAVPSKNEIQAPTRGRTDGEVTATGAGTCWSSLERLMRSIWWPCRCLTSPPLGIDTNPMVTWMLLGLTSSLSGFTPLRQRSQYQCEPSGPSVFSRPIALSSASVSASCQQSGSGSPWRMSFTVRFDDAPDPHDRPRNDGEETTEQPPTCPDVGPLTVSPGVPPPDGTPPEVGGGVVV